MRVKNEINKMKDTEGKKRSFLADKERQGNFLNVVAIKHYAWRLLDNLKWKVLTLKIGLTNASYYHNFIVVFDLPWASFI